MGRDFAPTTEPANSDIQIERTGAMIGRYKILQQIGEGGFGLVYMAEQVEPVQRKVALKIIKAGMDTKEVIARFEAERQAIALMEHPNIARALDAGTTIAGRPYFVMELVRGIPITQYCDQEQLTTHERLQLFIEVCQAVQHAHQKGVIHRDIKPSNVLVTEHGSGPVPKVIDFGVAKALGQRLTEKTLFTASHHLIGTPAYMSPEQAALTGIDIDTRADIYSLGVLLYELLTGVTPFDADTLRQAGLDEIRRMIQEIEPPKPSTRLHTLAERLVDVAKQRRTEPIALSRLLRGDLDWIVMKCLEKDRGRRYETANGVAADVIRHLSSEPVVACPPSGMYRFQKLLRRHKVQFLATFAVLVALTAGFICSAWLFISREATRRAAAAMTFNLAADFSPRQNPNRTWSYGWIDGTNSFRLYESHTPVHGGGLIEWHGQFRGDSGFSPPNVVYNLTNNPVPVSDTIWLPHQVTFHPGENGVRSVVRWTSPLTGTATLNTVLEGRSGYTTSGVEIYINESLMLSQTISGQGSDSRITFSTNLALYVGDIIDFRLNNGNTNWASDTTQIGVRIVVIPAPF